MSLEKRLSELEKRYPDRPPMIILYLSGDDPPLCEEDKERLIREAMERNPGQPMYIITWPPQERGQDDPHR